MAEQNPTVIIAHLNDEQLRKSIDSLVGYVDKQFQSMVSTTSTRVGEMQTKLNELSQIKVDSNGSVDGGSSKRAKSIQSEKQSLESLQMSYDKLLGALQMAQRQERVLAGKDIWTLTREELDKYAATLQHVSELEKSLSAIRGQMSLAMAEKGQFSPNMKEYTDGLVRTSDEMKKMSSYYKELEKSSDRVTQQVRQESGSYDLLAQQIQRAVQQADRRYSTNDEILNLRANLHNVEAQLRDVQTAWSKFNPTLFPWVKDTETYNNKLTELQEQLERVRMLRGNAVGPNKEDLRNSLGNELSRLKGEIEALTQERQKFLANESKESQLKEQYAEISKQIQSIGQSMIDVDNAEKGLTQTTQRYTEEVLKQAQAIRENKQFQEQGFVLIGDKNFYDPEKSLMPKKAIKSLEEQILTSQMEQTRQSQIQKENEEALAAETKGEATVRDKAAEARARMMRAEEEMLALTTSETAKQEEMNLLLQRAKTLYDEIKQNRTHDEKLGVSNSFQVQSTTESIQRLRAAYDALSESDKKSPFGKELRSYIKELERDLSVLTLKMEDEALMNNQLGNSYEVLARKLRRLQTIYNQLSESERNSQKGKDIADNIQKTSRYLNEIRTQESRPISLEKALGNPENTLDRIAHKIQQLNAYRGGLNLTDPKQVGEMRTVENEIDRLKKKQDELMGKNQQLMNSNNALARSWNYMKNRLAFYFTVGASTQFVKNLIEVRSQYEMNERALGILIDSAERGTQIFNELSQMALVSPYTLIELSTAAKQLSAYDVAAKDVVDTTRRLADISAAVGVPVERFTYALGQVKAFGHLTSQDARQFLNTGVPLVKELAKHYTELEGRLVSTADVYERMKKHAVSYNDVVTVLNKMTDEGGKFFDFQAKMADTLKVQLANLTLAWNNMLNEIGKSEQGVLVGGIKGLKELFLQWENISKAIRNVAWVLGIVKAAQLVYYFAVRNSNNAIALHNVLGNKMSRNLKEIAVGFRNAKNAITGASAAMKTFVLTTIAIAAIATEVVELAMAWKDAEEGVKNFNKTIRDGAAENYKNITNTLEQYKDLRESLYEEEERGGNNVRVAQDIDESNAKKAWESMREEIELSSAASETYISRLMQIDNVSERLRQGFVLLDDLQAVNSALSEMGDKTIFIQQDWSSWWNLWLAPDSFEENLRDFIKAKKQIEDAYGDIETAREKLEKASSVGDKNLKSGVSRYDNTLEQFRENLKETTDSIIDFISLKGWTGDTNKINELFAQFTNKTVMQLGLDPSEAFTLQLEVEQTRAKAAKQSLQIRLEDEKQALKVARDEETKEAIQANIDRLQTELNDFDENNGRGRVLWENYTKWMKEQHMSEMTQMFRDMDDEDIKSINFQEGKWKEFAERTAMQYAKEHKLSYNDAFNLLQNWVKNANKWSIFIPLTISTKSGKSVYEQLGEYDKIIDDADSQIKRLTTRIGELQAKQKLSKEEAKELADAQNELAQAERDKADAEAKGGHGKQESKDTKNATKAQKQAESDLQKALKDELSLLDKVRSQYKKLTDAGVDGTTALNMVTNQFTNSIQRINNILGRNGLPLFNIKAFAGTDNPNAVLEMLKKQLDAAKVAKNIKPSEIKELEVKYGEIVIDAKVYNTKKITDGLNNELSKIKDEYELAVELDANPELGNIFTDMFGIDTTDFPKTIDEYMQRVQDEFDKGREKFNYQTPLNVFKATENDWIRWGSSVGIVTAKLDEQGNIMADDTTALEKFKAKFVEAQGVAKKWAQDTIKQTQDLQYKLGDLAKKVEIEEAKLAVLEDDAAKETNAAQKRLLELRIQEQKEAIEKLKMESVKLLPFYEDLFGDMYNVSVGRLKEIAKAAKEVMTPRQGDSGVGYTQRTDSKGNVVYDIFAKDKQGEIKKTTVSLEEYIKINKQIDSVQQKIAESSPWEKIKDSFSKKEGGGLKNFASGMETIGSEMQKVANITKEIGGFAEALGADENTVEIINDISTSIGGVATAAQGIGQIASHDYIGGAASVLSGAFSAISTWFDNADKKILQQIKDSETAVKRLELAYIDLEHAIDDAYGMATIGAQKAAIANKELQLAELKRQLTLEQSRKKKNQDKDRIIELQKQIKELEYDIKSMTDEIVNDLLGISSVGDAMESLMDSFIEALRSGEDAMAVFDDSIDNMIANMVKKMFTTKILQPWFEKQWDLIQKDIDERVGKEMPKKIAELTGQVDTAKRANLNNRDSVWEALASMGLSAEQIHQYESYDEAGNYIFDASKRFERRKELYEKMLDDKEKELDAAQREYTELTTPTVDDIKKWAVLLRSGDITVEQWQGYLDGLLTDLDLMKDSKDKTLSNLQNGLQSMSEETGSALEAYMNGVSQQVYLQSGLLTQIRDAVVAMDSDAQIATNAQILLQLQQSYAVQMAIQSILTGWSNPSGQAVRVELLS